MQLALGSALSYMAQHDGTAPTAVFPPNPEWVMDPPHTATYPAPLPAVERAVWPIGEAAAKVGSSLSSTSMAASLLPTSMAASLSPTSMAASPEEALSGCDPESTGDGFLIGGRLISEPDELPTDELLEDKHDSMAPRISVDDDLNSVEEGFGDRVPCGPEALEHLSRSLAKIRARLTCLQSKLTPLTEVE